MSPPEADPPTDGTGRCLGGQDCPRYAATGAVACIADNLVRRLAREMRKKGWRDFARLS